MARKEDAKKLGKYFNYACDNQGVAHVFLNDGGTELARLQLSPHMGALDNTALVEEVLGLYYEYCKALSSRGR